MRYHGAIVGSYPEIQLRNTSSINNLRLILRQIVLALTRQAATRIQMRFRKLKTDARGKSVEISVEISVEANVEKRGELYAYGPKSRSGHSRSSIHCVMQ